jgi:hypothetical protein
MRGVATVAAWLQAHRSTAAAVVGTDAGHCAVYDSRSGAEEWLWRGDAGALAGVAIVPSPELRSIVAAAAGGQLLLLDARRSGAAAVLARVGDLGPLACVCTDGNCAIAGATRGVLVWNLDPAAEQTAEDRARGISCTGAGLAFHVPIAPTAGAVRSISVHEHEGSWTLAAGHASGTLSVCSFA